MFGFRDSCDFADFMVNFTYCIFHIFGAVALVLSTVMLWQLVESGYRQETELKAIRRDIAAIRGTVAP